MEEGPVVLRQAILISAVVAFAAAPVRAQSGAIAQCVATERKADRDGAACIGKIANPCLDKPEGGSTQGQVACVRAESKEWDELLTREYRALLAEMPAATISKIRDAQRQWLALRNADCALPYLLLEGGTMAQPIAAACYQHRTAERAIQVMRWRGLGGR